MRLALQNYEAEHGKLPPLCVRDSQGSPILSWRGLVLPYLDSNVFKALDLSQAWDSGHNRKVVDGIPLREWTWFARDTNVQESPAATHILAYLGPESIWDASTGLPKGAIKDRPGAILLISVPESGIQPLQPDDITEQKVRRLVQDGNEILFVTAGVRHGYGVVSIEDGKLTFHSWQEK